jgi:hypothetical protein
MHSQHDTVGKQEACRHPLPRQCTEIQQQQQPAQTLTNTQLQTVHRRAQDGMIQQLQPAGLLCKGSRLRTIRRPVVKAILLFYCICTLRICLVRGRMPCSMHTHHNLCSIRKNAYL